MMRTVLLGGCVALAACGGGSGSGKQVAESAHVTETCSTTIPPRSAALPELVPGPPEPRSQSRLVAHAELALALLAGELDRTIPVRVAEERGRDIGMGGDLDYEVDRSPFAVTVSGDTLLVTTELRGNARARAKGRTYASCEPLAKAVAAVPLRVGADYRFAPSRVSVTFTRGCKVKLGFIRVDVTPTLEAQLGPAIRRVERGIDSRLPPLRPQAERLWASMARPHPLPLGACAVLVPERVEQGPVEARGGSVRLRFGVVATAELQTKCGEPRAPRPLPPLAQDPSMPAEDAFDLALVLSAAQVAAAAEGSGSFAVDAGGSTRAQPRSAKVDTAVGAMRVDLGMRGAACGDVATRMSLAWAEGGTVLVPTAPVVEGDDAARLAQAGLDAPTFARGLGASLRIPVPLAPADLRTMLPQLAASMSDERLEVVATVSDASPSTVTLRKDGALAKVRLRGNLTLRPR